MSMARKKIREYDSKRLLKQYIMSLAGLKLPLQAAQVSLHDKIREAIAFNCLATMGKDHVVCDPIPDPMRSFRFAFKLPLEVQYRLIAGAPSLQVTQQTDFVELLGSQSWLNTTKLVRRQSFNTSFVIVYCQWVYV